MKNLLTISQEEFDLSIKKISFGTLKNLLAELFKYIKSSAWKIPQENIIDLERKQTKIWRELQARGHLNFNTNEEFMKWLYRQHTKKYY